MSFKIGDRVVVKFEEDSGETTYKGKEVSCGVFTPAKKIGGTIIGVHHGWFKDKWIVSLDNGEIIRI